MKILAFGEVLWDIYPDSEHIGGAPFNFAAHFKKCGGNSWVISAVGNDELGDKTIEIIEKMGVGSEYVSRSQRETGKCLVTLNEKQIPSYNLLNNVAYDDIKTPELTEKFDVLYFGTLALRNDNNQETIKEIIKNYKFDEIFCDLNIRPPFYSEETINLAMMSATILKISDEELPEVMKFVGAYNTDKEGAELICSKFKNVRLVIITKGENGSFVYDAVNLKMYECKAKKTEVISTVGAGDSFSAAFLAKYLRKNDISACLNFASEISGIVVSKTEAIPEYNIDA